jgi:hypothetical protein
MEAIEFLRKEFQINPDKQLEEVIPTISVSNVIRLLNIFGEKVKKETEDIAECSNNEPLLRLNYAQQKENQNVCIPQH